MTQIGSVYGEALYSLAKDENLSQEILQQLQVLDEAFRKEKDFIRLLGSPNLTKAQRVDILDESFRGKVHSYVLNFLKILTEKGYMRSFSDCCTAFTQHYNEDNNILPVTAVTAVVLNDRQVEALTAKLTRMTGKTVVLSNKVSPDVLGGVRLDYDGQRLDDTVTHRLSDIQNLLKNTAV